MLLDTQAPELFQAPELSTQAQRSGTSGTFILRYNMQEHYRTEEVLNQSDEEYQQTGMLYVILGLIFLNGNSITSRKFEKLVGRDELTVSI